MPIITAESRREMYQHFPPYSSVAHREGKLYLFHYNYNSATDPIFRQQLFAALNSCDFANLDMLPTFTGGRVNKGFVGILPVNESESIMLKRTRHTLSELRALFNTNLPRRNKLEERWVTSYYLQANAWFSAAAAYKEVAALNPEAPSHEIALEECLGIMIRQVRKPGGSFDTEYWTITRYYPPVDRVSLSPAEKDAYDRAEQLVKTQYKYLEEVVGYTTFDVQTIITRKPDGTFEGKLIDLEFLQPVNTKYDLRKQRMR